MEIHFQETLRLLQGIKTKTKTDLYNLEYFPIIHPFSPSIYEN